jgi:hypothetical protein
LWTASPLSSYMGENVGSLLRKSVFAIFCRNKLELKMRPPAIFMYVEQGMIKHRLHTCSYISSTTCPYYVMSSWWS